MGTTHPTRRKKWCNRGKFDVFQNDIEIFGFDCLFSRMRYILIVAFFIGFGLRQTALLQERCCLIELFYDRYRLIDPRTG